MRELERKLGPDDAMAEVLVELAINETKQKSDWKEKCMSIWGNTVMYLCWTYLPLTCCSRLRMTATAWWRIRSFVWGFSLFKWSWHIRPSSLNASLISRTRKRSLALLAIRLSFSLSIFCSGFKSSSSLVLLENKVTTMSARFPIKHGYAYCTKLWSIKMKIKIIYKFYQTL